MSARINDRLRVLHGTDPTTPQLSIARALVLLVERERGVVVHVEECRRVHIVTIELLMYIIS